MILVRNWHTLLVAGFFVSCASYKANVMFKPGEDFIPTLVSQAQNVDRNYTIQPNDLLTIEVFSNQGERLIDPNPQLSNTTPIQNASENERLYQVDLSGTVKLPLVGEINLEGLTLREAESELQDDYGAFFKEPYVQLAYFNKRVIILGAMGGNVIPLTNSNTTLIEVLALADGLPNDSRANNIRLLRGDEIFILDLSTLADYARNNPIVEPGDIIYVEPVRRPVSEGLQDYGGIISLVVSLTSLIAVIANLR